MPQLRNDIRNDRSRSRLPFISMTDTDVATNVLHNADAPWNAFSSYDYWCRNYRVLQPEDQEIIRLVSQFFMSAFADRPPARRAIDVGSGTNLYPALLMLPWAEQILLTDYSKSNIGWLHEQLADDASPWTWQPFWHEMLAAAKDYGEVDSPRKMLREACVSVPGYSGIEQCSVFGLPEAEWDLGTMFFVAESITTKPAEFRDAVERFFGALRPGAPFATAFMAGSKGYEVAETVFPAVPVNSEDIRRHFTELGADGLAVEVLQTKHRVRDGYAGMIVATGFARS
jgi:hypothetical protein